MSAVPQPGQPCCAACGAPGQMAVAGQERDSDLGAAPLNGVLALVCRRCREIHAIDRAARRPRP